MKKAVAYLMLISTSFWSCGSKTELQNFDYDQWVSDPGGCSGKRLQQRELIEGNLESFKGLDQNEVKDLLGKPDKNELYKRSQKFFIYHIGPSEDCEQKADGPSPYLSIRFNAMGLAKEVLIYEN